MAPHCSRLLWTAPKKVPALSVPIFVSFVATTVIRHLEVC